jgi:transcriptional regulator with XRE-family HTH domain
MLGWKVSALAGLAGVSVSTIERIGRGEKISDDALDCVANAFGHEAGYYARLRTPVAAQTSNTGTPKILHHGLRPADREQ